MRKILAGKTIVVNSKQDSFDCLNLFAGGLCTVVELNSNPQERCVSETARVELNAEVQCTHQSSLVNSRVAISVYRKNG